MDVKFFIDRSGFHINELKRPGQVNPPRPQQQLPLQGVQNPFQINAPRAARPIPAVNQQQQQQVRQQNNANQQVANRNAGLLSPTFTRPDLIDRPAGR